MSHHSLHHVRRDAIVNEPRSVGVAQVVKPQPAGLLPSHVLDRRRLGVKELSMPLAGVVGPACDVAGAIRHHRAEEARADESRPPDPGPEQRSSQCPAHLIGEDQVTLATSVRVEVGAQDGDEPGRDGDGPDAGRRLGVRLEGRVPGDLDHCPDHSQPASIQIERISA